MRSSLRFVSVAAVAAMLAAVPGSAQKTTGPKERYEMDVATMSGFAAMAGGGRGGLGGAMSMMFGGDPSSRVAYTLNLRLGSDQSPSAPPPKGDHYFEPQAKLGKSVPLIAPQRAEGSYTTEFERPKGRLLLYWGCGAKAGPGQPVIIDFAKIAAGQVPPGLFSSAVPIIREVSQANSKSYADWPNSKGGKQPQAGSSLIGAHRINSNVGSDINFNLAQDYMPGLQASTAQQADGSVMIRWGALQPATGYVAWTIGGMDRGGGNGDMVWWTSSASKEFGGGLWDWLPPSVVANLIATIGSGGPHLVFCGHVDVVPPGDAARWQVPPFSGDVSDGYVHGRGAVDMKGGIAAFLAAAMPFAAARPDAGRLTLLLTGDEEGPAVNGTVKLLDHALRSGMAFDAAIVGEPTSRARLGDMVKIGRRGSLSMTLRVTGRQGHVAYP
ncbi:MAG: M20/M25/M40 family metallo-hydrolase, partial [Rhizobiales bacterium]|nr:M20/M25/M40 family metallo-hydrolase [Hyphomicrobiales bacterium]